MTALYPTFLKLAGLRVIVVGGGPVAAGKLEGLLVAGALITVVAPQITPAIRARAEQIGSGPRPEGRNHPAARAPLVETRSEITLIEREFVASDLDGARWVVAAAPPEINHQVATAATARGLFVNAVDDTASATAYLGGVVRRGPVDAPAVEIAISTRGVAPALAGLLREALDAVLPEQLERWIEVAKAERIAWKRAGIAMEQRRPLLLKALNRLYAPTENRRPLLLRAISRLYPNGWPA